jgi:hypothetical protein
LHGQALKRLCAEPSATTLLCLDTALDATRTAFARYGIETSLIEVVTSGRAMLEGLTTIPEATAITG